MAEQEKKPAADEAGGAKPASRDAGRDKARARAAGAEKSASAEGPSALDMQRLHVALEQARFDRERMLQERCSEANEKLGALHAEVNERLSERGAELQEEMMELWQKIQARQTSLWQAQCGGLAMEPAEMREAGAELARAQLRLQALQATLCNLAVLDPRASEIWFEGVSREAEIRTAYEADVSKLDEGHGETVTEILGSFDGADLKPGMRMQLDTLRAWYGGQGCG